MKKRNYSDEDIEASKLCVKTENRKFVDVFQRRLMIPIKDENGQVIAFAGRKIDYKNNEKMPYHL